MARKLLVRVAPSKRFVAFLTLPAHKFAEGLFGRSRWREMRRRESEGSRGLWVDSETDVQRENREIRMLLRSLRRPRGAESDKLGLMLRDAYGTRTARAAVLVVIDEAFSEKSPAAEMAREIIERCDIRGESTKTAARAMGFSMRSLFRYRVDAMRTVSLVVERALKHSFNPPRYELALARLIAPQQPKAALDIYIYSGLPQKGEIAYDIIRASVWAGLEVTAEQLQHCEGVWGALARAEIGRNFIALGRLDEWAKTRAELAKIVALNGSSEYAAAAFELAWLERIDARRTANLAAGAKVTERIRAASGRDPRRVALALIAQAEQSCCEGSTMVANVNIAHAERVTAQTADPIPIARCAWGQALLSFMYERYGEAIAFASAAATVLPGIEAGFTVRCQALSGRAAYIAGVEWSHNETLPERYRHVWPIAELNAIRARHLQHEDLPGAYALASNAIDLAIDQDARGALAYAKAIIAQILRSQGKLNEADALSLDAWSNAVRLGDHSYLFDMFFVRRSEPVENTPWFVQDAFLESVTDFYYELLRRPLARWTQLRSYIRALIRSSLEAALGRTISRDDAVTTESAQDLLRRLRIGRRLFLDVIDVGPTRLLEFLPYLVAPDARTNFRTAFKNHWASIVRPVGSALPE
jgi:hypothetical protein